MFASATDDSAAEQSAGAHKHSRRYAAKQQSKQKHGLLWAKQGQTWGRDHQEVGFNNF